ncbi:MAG: hypothetical protein GF329_16710 [Candidatus Lokiarchaeota archaeon]|nr:hypothetical protein [Candidatus Lokiarchaeota archaeon]
MNNTLKIVVLIGIMIGSIIGVAIAIPYIMIGVQTQNSNFLESRLRSIFTAEKAEDLEGLFSAEFESAVPLDYLFFIINQITTYYGDFENASVSPRLEIFNVHSYTLNLENSNTTGTIGFTPFTQEINSFWISYFEFYPTYLKKINWSTIYDEYSDLPGNKSLLIAKNNEIVHSINTGDKLQVASTFKLYVLEALHEKIVNHSISLDTEIPILDNYKSLPSGILHNEENGTLFTLKELADFMINISDNTATDHLIYYLNRTYVESFLPSDYPFPLLTTAESFKLRWLINDSQLNSYLAMNETEKRVFLDNNISKLNVSDIDLTSLNMTYNIDSRKSVEWTFNATDIYKIQNRTKYYNSTHLNPGLADPNDWKLVSFKGGSDVGVYSLAHSVQANNGTWFYCVIITNNYDEFQLDYGSYVAGEWGYSAICQKILGKLSLE